jgi:hypothetical protein
MQPVLPSVELPLEILPGAASAANLCVVNDLRQAFAAARFSWALWDDAGTCLAKGERILDIPGDGVSAKHPISLPALVKGNYQLETALYSAAGEKMGENIYKFSVEEKR